jgi:hypothetical protein
MDEAYLLGAILDENVASVKHNNVLAVAGEAEHDKDRTKDRELVKQHSYYKHE